MMENIILLPLGKMTLCDAQLIEKQFFTQFFIGYLICGTMKSLGLHVD